MIWSVQEQWRSVLDKALAPFGGQRITRTGFFLDEDTFRSQHCCWQERLPDGFTVAPHTAATLAAVGGMDGLWGSYGHFLANGVGCCVMHQGKSVASSQTVAIGGGHAEVGVGTSEGYRRRGLATAAACAVIQELLRRGITPDWGCYYNPASGALAERLGFGQHHESVVNYVRVTPELRRASQEHEGYS